MIDAKLRIMAHKKEVFALIASGKYPPITTTILWAFIFGWFNKSLIELADKCTEDTNVVRALRGCNTDLSIYQLREDLFPHIVDDLLTDLNLNVRLIPATEEEILKMIEEEKENKPEEPRFAYARIPHSIGDDD